MKKNDLNQIIEDFISKKITRKEAVSLSGLSRNTFAKKLKTVGYVDNSLQEIRIKIKNLNDRGYSDAEIAKELDLDLKYINSWRKKLNLPKNINGKPTRIKEITKEIIEELYYKQLKSLIEI